MREPVVQPLGDRALVLSWEQVIDRDAHREIVTFANHLRTARLPGLIDILPAYASLTLYFESPPPRGIADLWQGRPPAASAPPPRTVRIPVRYDGQDLDAVAQFAQLSTAEVIQLHASRPYHVYLVGFMPGFAYLADVDPRIAAPRRSTPRASVPAGSVGIAGPQTGVYPFASPGGWQLIGTTRVKMFDPAANPASLLRPGDEVIFEAE